MSREMAERFIVSQKKLGCAIGLGFMAFALAGVPYLLFVQNAVWRCLGMALCGAAGIAAMCLEIFSEQQEYRILKREPLFFDAEHKKELIREYFSKKKSYLMGVVPSTVLLILGLVILGLTKKGHFTWSQYHAFAFLAAAIGVFGFVYFLGAMETYELLVKNEAYTASFSFRLKKKIKKILEI